MFDSKQFLKTVPDKPGVYRMYDKQGRVIYVGKAKNLKKRVSSYFRGQKYSKTAALLRQIEQIELIITRTENEALLLENTLIKTLKPKYNILFKDDKSYPYIHLSAHKFPRLSIYRSAKKRQGQFFGPYANGGAARETLHVLQKIFFLRQCDDLFFRNRSRPCVQYQIKRCSAPCVNYITEEEYQENVRLVTDFLQGKNRAVLREVKKRMQFAAENKEYELAVCYRDQLMNLEKIFEQQFVAGKNGDVDAIAMLITDRLLCVQILFIRMGRVTGTSNFIFKPGLLSPAEIMSSFVIQYYLNEEQEKVIPNKIIINTELEDRAWVEKALQEQLQSRVKIAVSVRGTNRKWLEIAESNAKHSLATYAAKKADISKGYLELKNIFKLRKMPQSMECFDISHTVGERTLASCVVFDAKGAKKSAYRRFNITDVTNGDDYAAIKQVLERRYAGREFPDLVVIDGGKGQLNVAKNVLGNVVDILAIAKGPTRKAGLEEIYAATLATPIFLASDSSALHLLQQIRDEAHRFAISGHRKQRAKATIHSLFEQIPGVGPKTRQKLLTYFGGLQEIKSASIGELQQVSGISRELAQRISASLHVEIKSHH